MSSNDELQGVKVFSSGKSINKKAPAKVVGDKSKAIGSVTLLDGTERYIQPMHSILLNYTFEDKKNWKYLKDLINIYLETYNEIGGDVSLIGDDIKVATEYEYWVSGKERSRRQDFLIEEGGDITYIEFQNDNKCSPPIQDRSIQYFGLGVGQKIGGISNQIWVLAKPVEELLHGQSMTCYKLLEERKGFAHPNKSYIMFVDLEKLANEYEGLEVQEMSKFLLNGKAKPEYNERAIDIAETLCNGFIDLKNNREVVEAMTLKEELERQAEERERIGREEGEQKGREEGEQRGREEGEQRGRLETAKSLLKENSPIDFIMRVTNLSREQINSIQSS